MRYETSLEGRLWSGASYDLSFDNSRLENTLNGTNRETSRFRPEYESSLSLTITQPLLRDFGFAANLAEVRLAESEVRLSELDFDVAIMEAVMNVINAYIEMVYAQEEIKVKQEAIALAEGLKKENQRRLDLGLMSPIDVIQADVAIAESEGELIQAESILAERVNVLKTLLYENFGDVFTIPIHATDELPTRMPTLLAPARVVHQGRAQV